jgi:hypothetical protein
MSITTKALPLSLAICAILAANFWFLRVAFADCHLPIIVDCPVEKAYCMLRTQAQCHDAGFENFTGPFSEAPDPFNWFDTIGGNVVACWAECECEWDGDEDECICNENSIG